MLADWGPTGWEIRAQIAAANKAAAEKAAAESIARKRPPRAPQTAKSPRTSPPAKGRRPPCRTARAEPPSVRSSGVPGIANNLPGAAVTPKAGTASA